MSLAAKLAAKANELKTNPSAQPLSAAEADLDRLAIASQLQAMQNLEEAPPGAFIAQRLNHLITKDGNKVMPTNGFFIPQTQEQYEMLMYYAGLNTGLTEQVPEPKHHKAHDKE